MGGLATDQGNVFARRTQKGEPRSSATVRLEKTLPQVIGSTNISFPTPDPHSLT